MTKNTTKNTIENTLNRRQVLKAAAVVTASMAVPAVLAQSAWPSKPIRFVVPFAPGGTSEIVARAVAVELTKQLGVSVFVENKPGGAVRRGCVRPWGAMLVLFI